MMMMIMNLQVSIVFEFVLTNIKKTDNIDDEDDENGKTGADDLSDVGKLLKNDAVTKGLY